MVVAAVLRDTVSFGISLFYENLQGVFDFFGLLEGKEGCKKDQFSAGLRNKFPKKITGKKVRGNREFIQRNRVGAGGIRDGRPLWLIDFQMCSC